MPILRHLLLLAAGAILCPAQTAAPQPIPAFEVASIKPTRHGRDSQGLSISDDPKATTPATFQAINNSLGELIRWAYRVKKISGRRAQMAR
jgi:hypothetical protein